jgi:DNA-binding ferritin-like protein
VVPKQGYRSCLGIFSLSKRYSKEQVEAAAERAVTLGAYSYQSVKSILKTEIGQLELQLDISETPALIHENIRGAAYYQNHTDKELIH